MEHSQGYCRIPPAAPPTCSILLGAATVNLLRFKMMATKYNIILSWISWIIAKFGHHHLVSCEIHDGHTHLRWEEAARDLLIQVRLETTALTYCTDSASWRNGMRRTQFGKRIQTLQFLNTVFILYSRLRLFIKKVHWWKCINGFALNVLHFYNTFSPESTSSDHFH